MRGGILNSGNNDTMRQSAAKTERLSQKFESPVAAPTAQVLDKRDPNCPPSAMSTLGFEGGGGGGGVCGFTKSWRLSLRT
mmetsp:Transcript_30694/g.49262  ORF Transcript_30694/g.49262 Transcript_30694/m.49262 type:complete len:80 (-) Transcript_30694:1177-1416(-)